MAAQRKAERKIAGFRLLSKVTADHDTTVLS